MHTQFFFSILTSIGILFSTPLTAQLTTWEIQGTGEESPYFGTYITTKDNIVTVVDGETFFIQCPDELSDNNPRTSDALRVVYSGQMTIKVGDIVEVYGLVEEPFDNTSIIAEEVTVTDSNVALPTYSILDQDYPSGYLYEVNAQFEEKENMLVSIPQARILYPCPSGYCRMKAGSKRLFREPGIFTYQMLGDLSWDGNTEVIEIDFDGLGLENVSFVTAGAYVQAEGILLDDKLFLPTAYSYQELPLTTMTRAKDSTEISIGSFNVLKLFLNDFNYELRLKKVALYINDLMKSPDILALQEVENNRVLEDLIREIELLNPAISYTPFLYQANSGDFPINLGFLVSDAIQNWEVDVIGGREYFSLGGSLFGRPPLLLKGELATDPPTPIQVMNVHLRSFNGIDGGNAQYVRSKRYEQSVFISEEVNKRRDENLFIVGDYNAYQFTDGLVDVFNQISGMESLGAERPVEPIVREPLQSYYELLEPEQRYSYLYQNNLQLIDHVLSTNLSGLEVKDVMFARANVDADLSFEDTPDTPLRSSDHDGFVVYVKLKDEISEGEPFPITESISSPNPLTLGDPIYLNVEEEQSFVMYVCQMDGKLIGEYSLGTLSKGVHKFFNPFSFPQSIYVVRIVGAKDTYTRKVWLY